MSNGATYVQVGTTSLYVIDDAETSTWSAYYVVTSPQPPSVTVADSFSLYDGNYLFAPAAPSSIDGFLSELPALFSVLRSERGCFWIGEPNVSPLTAELLPFSFFPPSSWQVQQPGFASFISNTSPAANSSLQFDILADTVVALATSVPNALQFASAEFVSQVADASVPSIPSAAFLSLEGPCAGCFLFSGNITLQSNFVLPVGVRYAFSTTELLYPLIDITRSPSFAYTAALDPLNLFNTGLTSSPPGSPPVDTLRTVFVLQALTPLPTYFRTANGQAVQLVALGETVSPPSPPVASAAFIFSAANDAAAASDTHFTLAGPFALQVAGSSTARQLLCGLSGTETLSFRPYDPGGSYDVLWFVPRQPAFAPAFPPAPASLANAGQAALAPRLTSATYTTSWAAMTGDAIAYRAEPEGSPLFAPDASSPSTTLAPLAPAVLLPPGDAVPVPLAPYAGMTLPYGMPASTLTSFESSVLSAARRDTIAAFIAPQVEAQKVLRALSNAPTRTATTPQGLLAEVADGDAGTDYVSVTLAQSQANGGIVPFGFLNLTTPLQQLFQTNQLFAVIVNPEYLATSPGGAAFDNNVNISGWTMTAAVGEGVTGSDYQNVMIFKFGDGTVVDRVTNPNQWTAAADFSVFQGAPDPTVALAGLSQWLTSYFDEAIAQQDDPFYTSFVDDIITNPDWQGVLVLAASIDPSDLPPQVQGLAAGIDFSQFEAHHFGVTVNRVSVHGDAVAIDGPSSLFGLIDYVDPSFAANLAAGGATENTPIAIPGAGSYDFTVLQLQCLFKNGTLADFESRLQLTVNELFESNVAQSYGITGLTPANAVVLVGSYQTQGTTSTYVFQTGNPAVFVLDSNVLLAVTFDRVQFNTLSGTGGGSTLQSRFLVWGSLAFEALSNGSFDLFSFGVAPDTSGAGLNAGLSFSNLVIAMQSPVTTPNAVTYTFDASGIAFDPASSAAREGSLFSTFALQIDSFIVSDGSQQPSDYGYLAVTIAPQLEPISGPWYGIAYKVTMGTPGALVSDAGFTSRLLTAWSPQSAATDDEVSAFAGLQLPGASPGGSAFSLQGVLKLTIGSIELLDQPVTGSPGTSAFVLALYNVGLTFLGIEKLPPDATINFFLFGNPAGTGSLGWYAAYVSNASPASNARASRREIA